MTLLDTAPRSLDPEPERWDYDLSTLTGVGVTVTADQAALLDPEADGLDVVVPFALPDPLGNLDGYRCAAELPRLITRDTYGYCSTVVVPVTGRVDWGLDGVADLRGFHEPHWYRFPTVPVRIVIPDRFDEVEENARPVRVWNTLPVDADTALAFADIAEELWTTGWYHKTQAYAAWQANRLTSCALLTELGVADQHVTHPDPIGCPAGDSAALRLGDELFLDGARGWYRRVTVDVDNEACGANVLWRELTEISRRCTAALFDVVPWWEREALIGAEQEYCPWVLS